MGKENFLELLSNQKCKYSIRNQSYSMKYSLKFQKKMKKIRTRVKLSYRIVEKINVYFSLFEGTLEYTMKIGSSTSLHIQ